MTIWFSLAELETFPGVRGVVGGGGMDFVSLTIAKVSHSFKLSLALISIDLLIICIPRSLVLSIG